MVSFDPVALQKGATAFTTKGGAVGGYATTVANLAALRAAFGGVGRQVWPAIEAELDRIRRELEGAGEDATRTGTGMGTTGTSATTIDQDHDNNVRNTGDIAGR